MEDIHWCANPENQWLTIFFLLPCTQQGFSLHMNVFDSSRIQKDVLPYVCVWGIFLFLLGRVNFLLPVVYYCTQWHSAPFCFNGTSPSFFSTEMHIETQAWWSWNCTWGWLRAVPGLVFCHLSWKCNTGGICLRSLAVISWVRYALQLWDLEDFLLSQVCCKK